MDDNQVIYPPKHKEVKGPVIFLAGPIQGAPDWQKDAIKIIHSINRDVFIANPRREYLDEKFVYDKQVDWETEYLNKAAQNGAIIFWLAKELNHFCERAYAQTSRFEIAEWKARHEKSKFNLIIGIEDGFTGGRYIKHRTAQDCPDIKILNNLEDVCRRALESIFPS